MTAERAAPLFAKVGIERDDQGDRASTALEDAVRRLVVLATTAPAGSDASGVLVDLVIDGIRCVVSRPRAAPAEATSPQASPADAPAWPSLSPREQEIARMVGKGYTNKEIAAVLDISSWTVSTHLRRIFSKLEVCSRAAMVARLLVDGEPRAAPGRPALAP